MTNQHTQEHLSESAGNQTSVHSDPVRSNPADVDVLDWTERNAKRTESEIKTADTYSRFVEFMRIVLPVGAAALVISVVLYSSFWGSRDGISFFLPSETDLGKDLHMTNPKFIGHDSSNRPIEVTAVRALQDSDDPDLVHLETIKGKMVIKAPVSENLDELTEITLSAMQGNLNSKTEQIVLQGSVQLRSNTNYVFMTEEALVDLKKNEIVGSVPVHGEGALGAIDADTFRIWGNGNHILFSGNVNTRFFPGKVDDQSKTGQDSQ